MPRSICQVCRHRPTVYRVHYEIDQPKFATKFSCGGGAPRVICQVCAVAIVKNPTAVFNLRRLHDKEHGNSRIREDEDFE
jgi:hypothetical protein